MGGAGPFIFLLFMLGLASGIIGKIKGSSFVLWFAVGFFTAGVGIIAAVLSRVEREEPRRNCPVCGNNLPLSDQVCMRCGEDLDPPEELFAAPEPAGRGGD